MGKLYVDSGRALLVILLLVGVVLPNMSAYSPDQDTVVHIPAGGGSTAGGSPVQLAYWAWDFYHATDPVVSRFKSFDAFQSALTNNTALAVQLSNRVGYGIPAAPSCMNATSGAACPKIFPYGAWWNPYYLTAYPSLHSYQMLRSAGFDAITSWAALTFGAVSGPTRGHDIYDYITQSRYASDLDPELKAIRSYYGNAPLAACVEEPNWYAVNGTIQFWINTGIPGLGSYSDVIHSDSQPYSPPGAVQVPANVPVNPHQLRDVYEWWLHGIPHNAGVEFAGRQYCRAYPDEVVRMVGKNNITFYNGIVSYLFPHDGITYFYKLTPDDLHKTMQISAKIHDAFKAYEAKHRIGVDLDQWTMTPYDPMLAAYKVPWNAQFPSVVPLVISDLELGGIYNTTTLTQAFANQAFEWFRLYGPFLEIKFQYDWYWNNVFAYYNAKLKPLYDSMRKQILLRVNPWLGRSGMTIDPYAMWNYQPLSYPVVKPETNATKLQNITNPYTAPNPPLQGPNAINLTCNGVPCSVDQTTLAYSGILIITVLTGVAARMRKKNSAS